MKYKLLLFILYFVNQTFAQQNSSALQCSQVNDKMQITLNVDYRIQPIATNSGIKHLISANKSNQSLNKGMPDVPYFTASIIVPNANGLQAVITNTTYIEIANIDLLPSKGNVDRTINPDEIPYTYDSIYTKNVFYPQQQLQSNTPYRLRDFYGQNFIINPFQYNPIKKLLRVYTHITIEVQKHDVKPIPVQAPFFYIYKTQFLNANAWVQNNNTNPGSMLIICHQPFAQAIAPLATWKTQTGMDVEVVSINSIGNDDVAIKDFITQKYQQQNLSYVLLVGDAQHITSPTLAGGSSDPSYGYIDGNDAYPEILIGRMCAQNVNQVITQVQRTIAYEKNPDTTSWPQKGIAIGSAQGAGTGLYGLADWDFERNIIRAKAMANDFTQFDELFDGSQGGWDANGNPTANDLSDAINDGRSVITYCGHGVQNACVTTNFSLSDVINLHNQVWPFFWAVACVNGDFTNGTCIAEALLQASDSAGPTGCVATFMASINQTWVPPMCAQEEMMHLLTADTILPKTFAALSVGGCIKMNNSYGNGGYIMTSTWHTFGDPSLQVRNKQPFTLNVQHSVALNLGTTQLQLNVNATQAYACLMQQGQIIATANISGTGILSFNPILLTDSLTLTVTANNGIPYIAQIPVTMAVTGYVATTAVAINDSSSNNNAMADFNETFQLGIHVKNFGAALASKVTTQITSSDTLVQLTNNIGYLGNIAAQGIAYYPNVCTVSVSPNMPDGHKVVFEITFTDSMLQIQHQQLYIVCNAPVIRIVNISVDDTTGNNNGVLDAGEQAQLMVMVANNGHAAATITDTIYSNSNLIFNTTALGNFNIQAGDTTYRFYNVQVPANTNYGSNIPIQYMAQYINMYALYETNYWAGVWLEDFETNTIKRFPWTTNNIPWLTQSSMVYQNNFAARSGIADDNETSTLQIAGMITAADSISFYAAVSSELHYDYLYFYIDGLPQLALSGDVPYAFYSYLIPAGFHTFTWSYEKDAFAKSGTDAAYLDNIKLPYFNSIAAINNNDLFITPYPNPVSQKLHIPISNTNKITALFFTNVYGQQYEVDFTNDSNEVVADVSKLSAGLYIIKLCGNGYTSYVKCVVQ
jgi:hypothetical protein